ncbi:MAG TPA: SDR family oxidoreductase [Steroidobacteraceae bacterium]|jgi:NAD(P)-dependent dehydrogenase (short-subunit alcohol dehydrogenase family)
MHAISAGAALVVGGTGGLGKAVCRCLSEQWEAVFFTYRSRQDEAAALEKELSSRCGAASALVDVRNSDSVSAALQAAKERFGSVGSAIFAAGVSILQPYVADITQQQWEEVVQTELIGFTNLVRASIPVFRAQNRGTIVAIGSFATWSFPPGDALSAVPKAAIEMLCRAVAREEGRHGIRANVVAPGIINAGLGEQFQRKLFAPEVWEGQRRRVPLKRFGEASEVAEAVAFLASEKSAYITGQTLLVDGGLRI